MGSVFQFKQFSVEQGNCAMKINTDGVLLAAQVGQPELSSILDIGTGTGVIALMLAQRYPRAQVYAVEIDPTAATVAAQNFEQSPFADRIEIFAGSFNHFVPRTKALDLIISNPPFYTNSLKNPDQRKALAKHTDGRFFLQLLAFAQTYLGAQGQLQLILPPDLADQLQDKAEDYGFYLAEVLGIRSYAGEPYIRKIIVLSRAQQATLARPDFIIYESKGLYTAAYKKLLQPYFLAF